MATPPARARRTRGRFVVAERCSPNWGTCCSHRCNCPRQPGRLGAPRPSRTSARKHERRALGRARLPRECRQTCAMLRRHMTSTPDTEARSQSDGGGARRFPALPAPATTARGSTLRRTGRGAAGAAVGGGTRWGYSCHHKGTRMGVFRPHRGPTPRSPGRGSARGFSSRPRTEIASAAKHDHVRLPSGARAGADG